MLLNFLQNLHSKILHWVDTINTKQPYLEEINLSPPPSFELHFKKCYWSQRKKVVNLEYSLEKMPKGSRKLEGRVFSIILPHRAILTKSNNASHNPQEALALNTCVSLSAHHFPHN